MDGTPTDSGDDTIPCSGANCRYKLNLTDAKSKAYAAGHVAVLTDLQKALGEGPLVANHGFGSPHPTTFQRQTPDGAPSRCAALAETARCVGRPAAR